LNLLKSKKVNNLVATFVRLPAACLPVGRAGRHSHFLTGGLQPRIFFLISPPNNLRCFLTIKMIHPSLNFPYQKTVRLSGRAYFY
jgi:hypothetical protein